MNTKTPLVQSVLKACNVLDLLTDNSVRETGMPLSALAAATGQRPNTLHNILRSLVAAGYVEASGSGVYREGPKCRNLRSRNMKDTMSELLRPVFDELARTTGEGVVFFILAGAERVQVYSKQCETAIKVANPDPQRHFFNLATTRVLAAWSGPAERAALIARHGIPRQGFEGAYCEASMGGALDDIRAAGHSVYLSQSGQVVNLAVPALSSDGALIGALGCYAPEFRCPPRRREELLTEMALAARRAGAAVDAFNRLSR